MALIAWFAHEMLWPGKVPFFRDLATYFYPMRFSLAQSLRAGELPLWNRHDAMGFPLLADFQSGAFYPPHWLLLVLPFFPAVNVIFLFHYAVAASGAYVLCRRWDYPAHLALIGATFFTFGGTIVSLTNLLNHFQAAVWLPWVLFFAERCLQTRTWTSFLTFTGLLLLQFLGGSPEIYVMSMAILFLDAIRLKADHAEITYRKIFLFIGAANILMLALAMAQVLPTAELIAESRSQRAIPFSEITAWSFHPLQLINLFFPDKHVDMTAYPPVHPFFAYRIPLLLSHYLGVTALLGIVLWFGNAPRKEKIFISALTASLLLMAAGRYTPVYALLLRLAPFLGEFRYPEKYFFMVYAALVFIIVRGLGFFFDPDRSKRFPVAATAAIFIFIFLIYVYLRLDTWPLTRFIAWARGGDNASFSALETSTLILTRLEVQLAMAFGLFVLAVGKQYGRLRESLVNALLVAIVFIDLDSAHRPLQFLVEPTFVKQSHRVLEAPEPEPMRVFYVPSGPNLHPSDYSIINKQSFSQFNALLFDHLLPNTGLFYGFDYMQEINALGRWPYSNYFLFFANRLSPEPLYRLLGVLNVKYIVSFLPREASGLTLMRHFPEYPSWLYRIERVIPRTYVVNRPLEERDPWKILDRLSSDRFKPLEEVLLNERVEMTAAEPFKGEAKIDVYKNQTVAIHAVLNAPGILVLADAYYPGWRVYVDGKEEKIYRANLFFRAVKLAAGAHRVEFRYEPRSFQIGLWISLTTLAVIVVASAGIFIRKRKRCDISGDVPRTA
jgi:hypothetical protein